MIVECSKCESKVNADLIGEVEEFDPEAGEPYKISLLTCPACGSALVAGQSYYQVGAAKWEWGGAIRLWPNPDDYLHWSIPADVRNSLDEAQKSYKAGAFSCCAVMCGRALEAICVERTNKNNLSEGLVELKKMGVIDGRLFDWSESLRRERNLGAHATGTKTSRADARDVLEFATAIC